MRRIELVAVGVTAVAGVAGYMGSASGQSNGDAAPIYGIRIPDGYRDWHLISGKQLTGAGGELKQLRAELGNDLAIKAFRDGTLPFPDGAIIAALHWNEESSDFDNQALAAGFPGLGLQSSFAGSAVNVQFMVKDSKRYAASGGWGFADSLRTANLAMRRCMQSASPATSLEKIATTFSHATHLRPETANVSILGGIDFLDAAKMATVAAAKQRQMPQMVADVLVGVLEPIGVRRLRPVSHRYGYLLTAIPALKAAILLSTLCGLSDDVRRAERRTTPAPPGVGGARGTHVDLSIPFCR